MLGARRRAFGARREAFGDTRSVRSAEGSLYNSLGGFASHSVNLTKLESFTVNNTFDQALFYLDIEGHDEEQGVKASLDILKKNTETLDILGVYQASDYRINH